MPQQSNDFDPGILGNPNFSYRAALTLAAASNMAYGNQASIRAALASAGMRLVTFVDQSRTNTQFFVASNDEVLLVSFRGTKEVVDWIQNLKIPPK